MKITNAEQLEKLESVISRQNVEAGKELLADGGQMWIFRTKEEVDADPDLTDQEKKECKERFIETGGVYAGWFRPPYTKLRAIPGLTPVAGCDTHGNYRGGVVVSEKWSH